MSFPELPGFTRITHDLSREWARPSGDFADDLWPRGYLESIKQHPTEWLVVEQYDYSSRSGSTGVSTFLTTASGWLESVEVHDWSARGLGSYAFIDPGPDEIGLEEALGGETAEFFVQVQRNHRLKPATVDISHPFVWFWDAIRDGNNWLYLDSAGIEHPLVRSTITGDSYQIEVRALELRRYLAHRGLVAVVQHDHVTYANSEAFSSSNYEFKNAWASFIWTPAHSAIGDGFSSFSRLLGKQVVEAIDNGPRPPALDYGKPEGVEHPVFIYGIDPASGATLQYTSNPDALANYFGANPDAPHYLTPIYFDPRVLNRYRDEPSKYEITSTRLSCLGLWSISIGQSTTGLIEVYLGDLGRDLPWQEWSHWKTHNVFPDGQMNEDRFRRDFLAEWAGEPSTLEQMRESLSALRRVSADRLGFELIRELDGPDLMEFERLQLPTTTEQRELLLPVLTLAKAFVDAIDERALREYLGEERGDRSLALLEKLAVRLGGEPAAVQPFRSLYRLRSSGGLAHWGGSEVASVIERLGFAGLTPAEIVEGLANGLCRACSALSELIESSPHPPETTE